MVQKHQPKMQLSLVLVITAHAAAGAVPFGVFKLETFGPNSIRVRVAPPGANTVSEPITSALLPVAPTQTFIAPVEGMYTAKPQASADPNSLTNGNLEGRDPLS